MYKEKEEQKKVEERLKQRHASNNKFAKKLKRFGMMENENAREAFNEMMREKNSLKLRQKGVLGVQVDSDAEDSEEDEDMSEGELRKRAIGQIEEEVGGSEEDSEAESLDSEVMETNFQENTKGPKKSRLSEPKGIAGLKFMKRGELKVKEQLKEQAKMLIQQLKEDQDILDASDTEEDVKPAYLKGNATKFSK